MIKFQIKKFKIETANEIQEKVPKICLKGSTRGKYLTQKAKGLRKHCPLPGQNRNCKSNYRTNQGCFERSCPRKALHRWGHHQRKIQPILDEFKKLIVENEVKKSFIGALIKIFTKLLSPRTATLTKIKKVLRVSTKIAQDLWPEQKLL